MQTERIARRLRRKMKRSAVKMSTVGVIALAVLVIPFVGWTLTHTGSSAAERTGTAPAPLPASPTPSSQPVLLVMGDSYTGGSDMNTGPTWPELLGAKRGWLVEKEAVGGTGYLNGGTETSFVARTPNLSKYAADMVVLAGGINDTDYAPDSVAQAATKVVRAAKSRQPGAKVVLFSPFANNAPDRAIDSLTAALRGVAQENHVSFVDVSHILAGRRDLIGSDGVHPTNAGHRMLAQKITALLPAMPR